MSIVNVLKRWVTKQKNSVIRRYDSNLKGKTFTEVIEGIPSNIVRVLNERSVRKLLKTKFTDTLMPLLK